MPQTDDPWGRQLLDSMILLIKEELHHFWQVREMMLARNLATDHPHSTKRWPALPPSCPPVHNPTI